MKTFARRGLTSTLLSVASLALFAFVASGASGAGQAGTRDATTTSQAGTVASHVATTGLPDAGPSATAVRGTNTAPSGAKTSVATTSTAVTISIDALSNRHTISPYVYGFAYPNSPADITNTGATEVRWGGDATSTYNWQLHTDNAAADYYFEDFAASGFNDGSDGSSTQFITDVKKAGANPLMTMVMLPWVALSSETSTTQGGTDNYHWSQLLDLFPLFGRHGRAEVRMWRCNQSRATDHSRSTVAREMSSTEATELEERPPKNFSSTILACRSSIRASSSRARSKATSSSSFVIGMSMALLRLTLYPPSRLAALRLRA